MSVDDGVRAELDSVTAALEQARSEYLVLTARIAGLEANQVALRSAIGIPEERSVADAEPVRSRTDHIVEVLTEAEAEMSITEVLAGLAETGRRGETYESVAAGLSSLARSGRIARTRRGVYSASGSADARSELVVRLGRQAIDDGFVSVMFYSSFFPADVLGGPDGDAYDRGRPVRLVLDGFPGDPIETDIDRWTEKFRTRAWKPFFELHGLGDGDSIVIRRVSAYEYTVSPARDAER